MGLPLKPVHSVNRCFPVIPYAIVCSLHCPKQLGNADSCAVWWPVAGTLGHVESDWDFQGQSSRFSQAFGLRLETLPFAALESSVP